MTKPLTAWESQNGSNTVVTDVSEDRITESGDTRITEAGDTRVTEDSQFTPKTPTVWTEG